MFRGGDLVAAQEIQVKKTTKKKGAVVVLSFQRRKSRGSTTQDCAIDVVDHMTAYGQVSQVPQCQNEIQITIPYIYHLVLSSELNKDKEIFFDTSNLKDET